MPRVSVVVPNFNHARYLDKRLSSILAQSFTDFEVVFLDDASTDNSLEVFARYSGDPRVRSIIGETNSGSPFVQWNKGIEATTGEFIWIAESDDFAEPNFLKTLVCAMDANPGAGIAYVPSWIVSENNEKLQLLSRYPVFGHACDRWSEDYVNEGKDEVKRFLAIQNTIPNASGTLIRRSVLDGGLRAAEFMKLCGDWLFWVRILLRSDIVYVSQPLNFFRQAHAASQRQAGSKAGMEALESFEIQKVILRLFGSDTVYIRRVFNHHLRRWASLTFHDSVPRSVDREIASRFRRVYGLSGNSSLYQRLRLWAYYFVVVPSVRTGLYQSTVGRLRIAYRRTHKNV